MNKHIKHDSWVFSTEHEFLDEHKTFIKKLEKRKDLSNLFYAIKRDKNVYITKGLIWFENTTTSPTVSEATETQEIFPTSTPNSITSKFKNDPTFKTHEISWIRLPNPDVNQMAKRSLLAELNKEI